ncbi:MAG TPA: ATP-binding protein [Thermoanaerobaculia bacterium]|nr:ATP-binding protein [Thermoanaerobaculia bacterium]
MARSRRRPASGGDRRLLLVFVAFGVFVVCVIGLFAWLIFHSMSEREIQNVLFDTRREAEGLAGRIADRAGEREDLYTAIAVEQETQTYLDSMPQQRDIVRSVEIRDKNGAVVFRSRTDASALVDPESAAPLVESPEVTIEGELHQQTEEWRTEFEVPAIEVPISDLGTLVIGISPARLQQRIEVLRGDLIRPTLYTAAATLGLLALAFWLIWVLWRRSRRLESAAAEAERMAYIGTLASGLAHEIRNPLNSLNLNMQMMKEEIDEGDGRGPTVGRLLSITRSEISRLERLVTDFLSYARPRSPEREEVRPRELFERVREVVGTAVAQYRGIVQVSDDSDARISADVAQLTQLLLNLVQNALASAVEAGTEPRVELAAHRRDGEVVLEVADNGPGIAAADRDQIFDVFYSTRKGGTGLGLAIVDRIARNHGGHVEVESAPGQGAVFRVVLPAADSAAA